MTFDEWWDTLAGTPAPDTFRNWEASCRAAWNAGVAAQVATSRNQLQLSGPVAYVTVQGGKCAYTRSADFRSVPDGDYALHASTLDSPVQPTYTTGHCQNHRLPGGCQLHNLQCGYPQCDRRETT